MDVRYNHPSLVEEKWIKKSEEGKWYNWERTLLLKTEDEKITVVALNIFERIICAFYQFFGCNYFKDVFGEKKVEIVDPKCIRQLKETEPTQEKTVDIVEKLTIRPDDYAAIKDKLFVFPLAFKSLEQLVEKLNRRTGYGVVKWKYDSNQVGIRTGLLRELKERGYIHDFRENVDTPKKYEIFVTPKDVVSHEKDQSERNLEAINAFQRANKVIVNEEDLAAIKHEIAFAEGFEYLYRFVEKINRRAEQGILKWKYDPAHVRTRNIVLKELKNRGYIHHYRENHDAPKKYEIFVKADDLAAYESGKTIRA